MLDIGMLGVDVQLLKSLVHEHESQIDVISDLSTYLVHAHFAMRASYVDLLSQHLALCDCICKTGLICQEDLLLHIRAARSFQSFRSLLEEPQPARMLLQHLGLPGSRDLLATCREGARLRAGADVPSASWEPPGCLPGASRVPPGYLLGASRARGAGGGGHVPAARGLGRGAGLPISLSGLWQLGGFAEWLGCALGAGDVRELRATSSSGLVCLCAAHGQIALRPLGVVSLMAQGAHQIEAHGDDRMASSRPYTEKLELPREGARRADLSARDESLQFCTFLQDIWQYSTLADALIYSMDASGMRHFRVLSRACCECMRSHRSCKQGFDSRQARVPRLAPEPVHLNLAPVAVHLRAAPVRFDRQVRPESTVGLPCRHHESSDVDAPSEAVPEEGAASRDACSPLPSLVAARSSDREHDLGIDEPRARPAGATAVAEGVCVGRALQPGNGKQDPARGKIVRLRGLRRSSHLNGKVGRVLPNEEASKHWFVLLTSGEYVRVRPANVEFIAQRQRDTERTSLGGHGPPRAAVERQTVILHLLCGMRGLLALFVESAGTSALGALAAASESLFRRISGQGKLYVCGGCGPSAVLKSVECLDLASGAWRRVPEMGCAREGAAAAVAAGRLYICGGSDGDGWLGSVERFDPRGGTWEPMPPMNTPRVSPGVGVLAGLIYLVGGQFHVPLRSFERFDPVRRAWQQLPPMRQARAVPMVVVVAGGLNACGGADLTYLAGGERFDPASGSWQALPPMAEGRYLGALATVRRRVFVCGGYDGAEMRGAERLDHAAAAWQPLPPMLHARCGATAAAARWRQGIVVCGGRVGQGALAEVLDLQAGAWEALQPSLTPRSSTGACVLAGGRLYVCGGESGDGHLSAVERLDLVSEKWEMVSPMSEPRTKASGFHTIL